MTQPAESAPNVLVFDTNDDVARAATERLVEIAKEAIESRGQFSVALAGGSTPKVVYGMLASDEFRGMLPWEKVHVFFGDERCVPPDHSDSNYRMAREAMLSKLPIPEQNIHRMKGEGDAAANAELYESVMREYFGEDADWPQLDLVMLGMGDDGHTASLFPGTTALKEEQRWVVSNWVEKFSTYRITLSAPAINHARHVMFIVTGAGKTDRLPEVLHGARDTDRLPSQLIRPDDGRLEWFVDRAAAAKL